MSMTDEDRGLIRRALDALSGQGSDPARQGLEQLISDHGREAVAKASADLLPQGEGETETEVTDEQLSQLLAEVEDPYEQRLKALEEKVNGSQPTETPAESTSSDERLPTDELELVKSGVPVEQIEEARPMLRSQDEQARQAAFAFLAKQADPSRRALLAKEQGSSSIPAEDESERARLDEAFDRAEGKVTPSGVDQLAQSLAKALAANGVK